MTTTQAIEEFQAAAEQAEEDRALVATNIDFLHRIGITDEQIAAAAARLAK